jgi:hypothetical protein
LAVGFRSSVAEPPVIRIYALASRTFDAVLVALVFAAFS